MRLSMEGVGNKEVEIEIYGRVPDMAALKASAASQERQEQWGVYIPKTDRNNATGNIRVRYTEGKGYVLTSKVKEADGSDEVELEVPEALMKHLRAFAESGLIKTRYFFPIDGTDLIYEVDVFENHNGESQWVKVDLESPGGIPLDNLPEFPFDLEDVRIIRPGFKSEEDLAFVRKLFDEEFNTSSQPV